MAPVDVALYVKLEWMNPFGSVKDRAAKWMIDDPRVNFAISNRGGRPGVGRWF